MRLTPIPKRTSALSYAMANHWPCPLVWLPSQEVGFYPSLAKPGYCSNRFCLEAKIRITNQSLTLCLEGWARKPSIIWPTHSLPEFTQQNPKLFACVIPFLPFMISNKSIALFFWAKCLVTGNQRNCLRADLYRFLQAWEN